jgi:hypothetical protein
VSSSPDEPEKVKIAKTTSLAPLSIAITAGKSRELLRIEDRELEAGGLH